jgi:RND family efflux transporter MFP subunit
MISATSSLFSRSPLLLVVALVASTSTGLVACKKPDAAAQKDSTPATAKAPVAIKVQKAVSKQLPSYLELSGTLAADERSEVATQTAGAVQDVLVDVGSRVKKGDPLVKLDVRDAALRAAQAGATLEQSRARLALERGSKFDATAVPEVKASKEAMDLAVQDAERQKSLFDTGGISQSQWDAARSRAEQAKAQYQATEAGARASYAGLNAAAAQAGLSSKQVGDGTIRAPFDGAIAEKRVSPGEFANVGRVMVVLVRDNPLRLKVDLAEEDLAKIQIDKKVEVEVAAFPGQIFPGVVKRLGASLNQLSRTLPIEAEIPNEDGKLRPGLFARARVVVPGKTSVAILVPESAVGTTGVASRVFVRNGTKVIEKLVKTGRHDGALVEVSGLTEADEVATTNVDQLIDAADVAVTP